MKLRKLELNDASLMLEWMHDKSVVKDLRTNFLTKTIEDCENFIKNSWTDKTNWNVAIVDDTNEYMGTVSLKNIKGKTSEFGITIRSCAMGKGYSIWAMKEALKIGFEEMGLEKIYWCVDTANKRAIRFYDKNGFEKVTADQLDMIEGYTKEQIESYVWYLVKKEV